MPTKCASEPDEIDVKTAIDNVLNMEISEVYVWSNTRIIAKRVFAIEFRTSKSKKLLQQSESDSLYDAQNEIKSAHLKGAKPF